MPDVDALAKRFEQDRTHLRGVAYRMLGSLSDADDAVQETWLRLHRSETADIENLSGWLTTVIARVCLDMLRARTSRKTREDGTRDVVQPPATTPEDETALATDVGLALLVVLEQLEPAERVAFVLHDTFAVPFDEIAAIVGRTPDATRQLASRARRRVQGAPPADFQTQAAQRATVAAFLAALRAGDVNGLIAVLAPDIVLHMGGKDTSINAPKWVKGAVNVFGQYGVHVDLAVVDGVPAVIFAPAGRLTRVMRLVVGVDHRIREVEIISEPEKLAAVEVTVPPA